jgi:hypothetical protein
MTHPHNVTNTLVALGFVPGANGALIAPADSTVMFTPLEGGFLRLRIALDSGVAVLAVLAEGALKVAHDGGAA